MPPRAGRWPVLISLFAHAALLCWAVLVNVTELPDAVAEPLPVFSVARERQARVRHVRRVAPTVPTRKVIESTATRPSPAPTPQHRRLAALSTPRTETRTTTRPMLVSTTVEPIAEFHAGDLGGWSMNGPTSDGANGGGRDAAPRMRLPDWPGLRMSVALGGPDAEAQSQTVQPHLINPLELIATSLLESHSAKRRRDIVFVLDVSKSMQDNIYAVASHLARMTDLLESNDEDFRIGIAAFHQPPWYSVMASTMHLLPLTSNLERVRRELRRIECSGGERALDAIMEAVDRVRFRDDADRSFVFVTDEFVDGEFEPRQVFGALYRTRVRVDVIGLDEPFQRALAAETGGVWIPISSLGS